MTLIIQLPVDLERRLRAEIPDFDVYAKEAALIEFYRQDKLSRYELSQALGLNRFETDGVLKAHNVTEDLPTPKELEEDFRALCELLDRESSQSKGSPPSDPKT